jgi:hypothetical protein
LTDGETTHQPPRLDDLAAGRGRGVLLALGLGLLLLGHVPWTLGGVVALFELLVAGRPRPIPAP